MIHYNGIESIIESTYLEDYVAFKAGQSDIEVNPTGGMDYIVGKVVIISNLSYNEEFVKGLVKNRNKVYSRVRGYKVDGILTYPYIIRPNFNVMWNGETLKYPEGRSDNIQEFLSWLKEKDSYSVENGEEGKPILYFPKIYGIPESLVRDKEGNVTGLGWTLHQVGINMCPRFKDMDILKTKKLKI